MPVKGQVIFEFTPVGAYVKVAAIHVDSGIEVTIVGDPMRSQDALERTAMRKLEMVMERHHKGDRRGGMVV